MADKYFIHSRLRYALAFVMMVPKIIHHDMDPRNIPATIMMDSVAVMLSPPIDAKIPMKLNIVMGFVSVRKNTVDDNLMNSLLELEIMVFDGLDFASFHARYSKKTPPNSLIKTAFASKNSEIIVRPVAAMTPYTASAKAAPNPTAIAPTKPNSKVLRMHNVPMGPTGAAIAIPIIQDFIK